jgi:hypothetical protein
MADFDSPWKEALEQYFESFLVFFFPALHADIDWARGFEMLDKELQQIAPDAELGPRTVDKLVKVWLRSGEEAWILIHIEVQTWQEPGFERRMFVYHYRISDRYNRPVVSVAILADESASWRPHRYESSYAGCRIAFEFPIVKLLDRAADWQALEQNANPFALIVLAYLKAQETRRDADSRLTWKMRLVKDVYARCQSRNEFQRLFRLIDWFLELPKPQAIAFWREIKQSEEEKSMPFITTPERMGREEGLREGLREGFLKAIQLGLKQHYGSPGVDLIPKVQAIAEPSELEEILTRIISAAPIEEIQKLVVRE